MPQNINTSNFILTEQVKFRNISIYLCVGQLYTHAMTNSVKKSLGILRRVVKGIFDVLKRGKWKGDIYCNFTLN